jgi:hypothetical protein
MSEQESFTAEPVTTFPPFWRRFSRFFLYPMQAGSIIRIALTSVIGGIFLYMPKEFGDPLFYILVIVFCKYALAVMGRTANGQLDEPDGVDERDDGDMAQLFKQLSLIGIMCLVVVLLGEVFRDYGKGVGVMLFVAVMPAGVMLITIHRSLLQALNPFRIIHCIRTIGAPYWSLCFILFSLYESGDWLQIWLTEHIHSWLALPLLSFVGFYFMVIAAHILGYVIYQYHEALGVHAAVSFEKMEDSMSPDSIRNRMLARLNSLMAEGRNDAALELLRDELSVRVDDLDLNDRYQKLLTATGRHKMAMHHARQFITHLVAAKRFFQALDLCEQWLKLDTAFKLEDSYQVHELASAAYLAKRQQLALDLLSDFDRDHPDHPHIPSVYLLTAKILSEYFQKNGEAMQILETLNTQFPDHTLAGDARQYMETLGRRAAIG